MTIVLLLNLALCIYMAFEASYYVENRNYLMALFISTFYVVYSLTSRFYLIEEEIPLINMAEGLFYVVCSAAYKTKNGEQCDYN